MADSPSFAHLCRSNDVPTIEEENRCRETIRVARQHLTNLNREIDYVPAFRRETHNIIRLRRYRTSVRKIIRDLTPVLSPIRRLPSEIISEIVLLALDDDYTSCPGEPIRGSPWKYTFICSFWRQVVVSTPIFWSIWRLPASYIEDRPTGSWEGPLQLVVERSKKHALDVYIGDHTVESGIFRYMLLERHRWRYVELESSYPGSLYPINDVKGSLPLLEKLDLWISVTREYDMLQKPFFTLDTFADAPRLHSVELHVDDNSCVKLILPWDQLTSYDDFWSLTYPHIPKVHDLSKVVECALQPQYSLKDETTIPAHLPCLRTLSIWDNSTLDFLTLPALDTLTINSSEKFYLPLYGCLARSHFSLRSLTFDNAENDDSFTEADESFISALRLIPTVTTLTIHCCTYNHNFVSSLIVNPAVTAPVLPQLTSMFMNFVGARKSVTFPIHDVTLVEMVESRWNPLDGSFGGPANVSRLETFHFGLHNVRSNVLSPQVMNRFEALVDQGFTDIRVNVGNVRLIGNGD